MKSIVCFIVILNFRLCTFGQNFTNGSVFNYSVGDTIIEQYAYYSGGSIGKVSTKLRAVIGKTVNVTGDTIRYRESRVTDTIIGNTANFQKVLVQETLDYINTNLQNVLSNEVVVGPTNPCLTQIDVGYTDTCGFKVHKKYLQKKAGPPTCNELPSLTRHYIEGLGVYQYTYSIKNPINIGHNSQVIFAHKVGQKTCGARVQLTTGLHENSPKRELLQLYPNPIIDNTLRLKTAEVLQLEIYSLDGRKLRELDDLVGNTNFDVSEFENGVYLLRFTNGKSIGYKKIVTNRIN